MQELIIPGLNGSGPDHWQSWWLRSRPEARLVRQDDWCRPDADAWCGAIAAAVEAAPGALLIAHSLGCAAIVRLAARRPGLPIGGALLVAPADVGRCEYLPSAAVRFGPLPSRKLPFASVLVASHNDPYVSFDRAAALAAGWGSQLIDLGFCGHINAESGFGPWPAGQRLADIFLGPQWSQLDRSELSPRAVRRSPDAGLAAR